MNPLKRSFQYTLNRKLLGHSGLGTVMIILLLSFIFLAVAASSFLYYVLLKELAVCRRTEGLSSQYRDAGLCG